MADYEVSKLMWMGIVVALAAGVFTIAQPNIKTESQTVLDKVAQVVNGIDTKSDTPPTSDSKEHVASTSTLNLDIARHPMTASDIKSVIDVLPNGGFKNISLRLGDAQHLMYKSEYLKNSNSEALSIKEIKDIVSYAKSKNITVIPDLDSPGHANALLAALKESHPDVYDKVAMDEGTLDYTTPEAESLMKTLYDEVFDAFSGQSTQAFVVGADEVPGGQDLYSNSLLPFINNLGDYANSKGFTPILWNDAVLKRDVSKLSKNFSIFYWAQGTHAPADMMPELVKSTSTVQDYNKAGIKVINANDYANTFGINNIGNKGAEDYFLDYLQNTSNPTLFDEIVDNEGQWWTKESLDNHGMVVSLWGENSDGITSQQITDFVARIKLPTVPTN